MSARIYQDARTGLAFETPVGHSIVVHDERGAGAVFGELIRIASKVPGVGGVDQGRDPSGITGLTG
jgi:hypothetical protein